MFASLFLVFSIVCLASCNEIIPTKCLKTLENCLTERNCYSRVKSIDSFCCNKAFKLGIFNDTVEDECQEEKFLPDVSDCLSDLEIDCFIDVALYLSSKEKYYEDIKNQIKGSVDKPEYNDECEHYSVQLERKMGKLCLNERDNDMEWICDLFFNIMKESPLISEICFSSFEECVVNIIDRSYAKEASITCCEDVLFKEGDYYENKKKCTANVYLPIIFGCLEKIKYCDSVLIRNIMMMKETVDTFMKKIKNKIGVPKSEADCGKNFKKLEKKVLKECRYHQDPKLDFYCNITEKILNK